MKTNTVHPQKRQAVCVSYGHGFTLIELLVVITIIAILAGVALPIYQSVILQAQQSRALQQARQIGLALRSYANDNEGRFPSGTNTYGEEIRTANDAFRSLIPAYIDSEAVFTVGASKFGAKADEKTEQPTEILKTGENHYAYVQGLTDSSKSLWPLLTDGTDGTGHFTSDESQLAGTWKGKRGILINVDSSGVSVPMLGPKMQRYIPRFDDNSKNALAVSEYMGVDAKLLEPAR